MATIMRHRHLVYNSISFVEWRLFVLTWHMYEHFWELARYFCHRDNVCIACTRSELGSTMCYNNLRWHRLDVILRTRSSYSLLAFKHASYSSFYPTIANRNFNSLVASIAHREFPLLTSHFHYDLSEPPNTQISRIESFNSGIFYLKCLHLSLISSISAPIWHFHIPDLT